MPVYYVMFTVCTIAISNILYKDFRYEDRRYPHKPRTLDEDRRYTCHTGLEPLTSRQGPGSQAGLLLKSLRV